MKVDFCQNINNILKDNHASDILLLNVEEKTKLAKEIIIATLKNSDEIRAVVNVMQEKFGKALRMEGITKAEWVVLDYDEVIIHLFLSEVRAKYNLEKLWKDYKFIKKESKEKKK